MSTDGRKSDSIDRALALRKAIKKKRPKATRQESWRYGRVHDNWRRPKGIDSKMRLNAKGWPAVVSIGRRGPKATRGLHPSGKKEVMVCSTSELERVVGSEQVARIGGQVSSRSREKLVARANELGIRILNPQRTRMPKPTE